MENSGLIGTLAAEAGSCRNKIVYKRLISVDYFVGLRLPHDYDIRGNDVVPSENCGKLGVLLSEFLNFEQVPVLFKACD
jgi:hypothetical protein